MRHFNTGVFEPPVVSLPPGGVTARKRHTTAGLGHDVTIPRRGFAD